MRRALAFPVRMCIVLAAAVIASPLETSAEDCNNKVCTDTGGGGGTYCLAAQSPPSTTCNDGPSWCLWDWCRES